MRTTPAVASNRGTASVTGYKNSTDVMPGWDRWYAFSSKLSQQYIVNDNGTLKEYTQDQQHETYYLRDRTETFIRNHAEKGPWFAWVSTHAPHGPQTIAPEFEGSYDDAQMPKPPSYDEADVSEKPAWVQRRPLMVDDCSTDNGVYNCHKQVGEDWRERQESLMSVDVMVKDLVNVLAETNQLGRTYIVFASDNGFLLGQHRLYSKGGPYEENQGIPFVVRGPRVRRGVTSEKPVANIDLAPTIAEWAGVEAPTYVDGRSFALLLEGTASSWRRYLLFEQFHHLYAGVRTADWETYVEHETGEKEYYDLIADPWQLDSAHSAPENAERLAQLSETLSVLKGCEGAGCRRADGGP